MEYITGRKINDTLYQIKKQALGDANPMEHKHPGYLASIKYNANKLR